MAKGMGKSKRMKSLYESFDREKSYELGEAVALVQKGARAKFDESIDVAIRLGIDAKRSEQNVRAAVVLPHGTGKNYRVGVFAKGAKAQEAKDAGADIVGDEDLAEKVKKGEIEFERCIATPDMMAVVGQLGRVLGPKGMMPNPRLGTVTDDVAGAVKAAKGGQITFRNDKEGFIHASIGRTSFKKDALRENIAALLEALERAKPQGRKSVYLRSMVLNSTMGVGVSVDMQSLEVK